MPRPSPYTDKQKAGVLEAVKSGRKAGKKWPEIHEAAKGEGFKSSVQYLMQFARASGAVRRRRRKVTTKATPETLTAKRKPGRPKAVVFGNGAGLAGIEAIVERMVEQRVRAKIGVAIKALDQAAGELKAL